jgi:hypothetical protein
MYISKGMEISAPFEAMPSLTEYGTAPSSAYVFRHCGIVSRLQVRQPRRQSQSLIPNKYLNILE